MTKAIEVGVFRIACCYSVVASQVEAFSRKTFVGYLSEIQIIGIRFIVLNFECKNTLKIVVR